MTRYSSPYSDSTRWLRGNLHAHTCCGRFMDVTESGPMYASLGYDFLAITDHNLAPDADQLRAWQEKAGLIVIPGEENGGTDHMLEIGVHAVTPTGGADYAARARAMRDAGGFVVGCHPQEYGARGEQNIHVGSEQLHAVEIFNGLREGRGCDEAANVRLWDEVLTAGVRVWAVATDDFHCQYTSPGHGWVSVQAPETGAPVTWEFIVEQLKAGAFYASTYPAFREIRLEGNTLHIRGDNFCQTLRVIGPGGEMLHEADGRELVWDAEPVLSYFRVEAHCGVRRAWTQPFYARS